MDQNVIGFYISVHNVAAGQHFESLHHLSEKKQGFFFLKRALFLHEFVHGTSVAVLVDKIEIIGSFEHIDVLDNIRTVLQVGQYVDLIDGALLQFGNFPELFGLDDLNGHLLFGDHMHSFVDLRVDPLSQLFFQLVVLYYLSHRFMSVLMLMLNVMFIQSS